jgi:S-adenosylmethionine hydrolase
MPQPLITLTTDFGEASPYVAAMKGVIFSFAPEVQIVDLGHQVPPQDVWHGAYFLAQAVPFFPPHALHVAVIDPGVGTQRRLLYCEAGPHRLLLPDNGLITFLADAQPLRRVVHLAEPNYWRPTPSRTFHGRDILAPVAARLALGEAPERLGPPLEPVELHRLPIAQGKATPQEIEGSIVFVDHFGNLITNLGMDLLAQAGWTPTPGSELRLSIPAAHPCRWVQTYGEAASGELVALFGSGGFVELAVVNGSAAARLNLPRGSMITLRR